MILYGGLASTKCTDARVLQHSQTPTPRRAYGAQCCGASIKGTFLSIAELIHSLAFSGRRTELAGTTASMTSNPTFSFE